MVRAGRQQTLAGASQGSPVNRPENSVSEAELTRTGPHSTQSVRRCPRR